MDETARALSSSDDLARWTVTSGQQRDTDEYAKHERNEHLRGVIARAMVHGDDSAVDELIGIFHSTISNLVDNSPHARRDEVRDKVFDRLMLVAAKPDIYDKDIYSYIKKCLRNAMVDVVRRRHLVHSTRWHDLEETADRSPLTDPVRVFEDADALDRIVQAFNAERGSASRRRDWIYLDAIQVIELMFLCDVAGERISRAEAMRRLDIEDDAGTLASKMSRFQPRKLPKRLVNLLMAIDPDLLTRSDYYRPNTAAKEKD